VIDRLVTIFVLLGGYTRTVIEPDLLAEPRENVDDAVSADDDCGGVTV
jgi:hypothetical protein